MYAYEPLSFTTDSRNSYITTYKVLEDNSVHFTSVRDLETHPDNFVIPLDKQIKMVCAYSDAMHSLLEDKKEFGWTMMLNSDGTSTGGRKLGFGGDNYTPVPWLTVHGIMMWLAWSLLGLVQIVTNRYMVHKYSYREVIHFWSGIAMFAITLPSLLIVYPMEHWKITMNKPNMAVLNLTFMIGLLVLINGIVTLWIR
jgi:hypothetical protein